MVTTGTGRQKIVVQDLLDKIQEMQEAADERDFERVHGLEDELKDLVLKGVQTGDFQGLSAKVAARLALSTGDIGEAKRYKA